MLFTINHWSDGLDAAHTEKADAAPVLLRRRVTPAGRQALGHAWSLPHVADARYVLSSRHGEFTRTFSLLQQVAARQELSPADFSLSVHHALAGLLSIAANNRQGHIAVASGSESFCFGLIEAAACLAENPAQPVMLIHFDDKLPEIYRNFSDDSEGLSACAFLLTTPTAHENAISITLADSDGGHLSSSHAADFMQFLRGAQNEVASMGKRHRWSWKKHAYR